MSKAAKHSIMLVVAALIWGVAFVAQSEGGDAIGPFSFNCVRNFIAVLVLIPVEMVFDKMGISHKAKDAKERKLLIKAGILCGIALFAASNFQQLGITYGTPVGKAGFLTTCYVIGVPILGLFLKRKCGWNIWIGVVLTVTGLYMLCINGSFTLQTSDILVLLSALLFSIQIMTIDHYIADVDGVRLAQIEFLVTGILTFFPMMVFEVGTSQASISAWMTSFMGKGAIIALLYAGVCSSGIAYTFQILGQDGVNPTIASLLMSLESVFSVLAGWVLLNQALSAKELAGCALIFCAVVLAQLPMDKLLKKQKS